MNEKLMNQVNEMKKQTIGVEIEMNSITREKAAKIAAEFFNTNRYKDTARRNGYQTFSAWDGQGREWKFQKDVSIAGPNNEKCELVTPICLALSQMAKTVRTASPKPQQNENPKYAMRTWLLRLGFIGEEFATARDILTRKLSGDSAFRNGRAA